MKKKKSESEQPYIVIRNLGDEPGIHVDILTEKAFREELKSKDGVFGDEPSFMGLELFDEDPRDWSCNDRIVIRGEVVFPRMRKSK